jgi:hypothetical protein
MLVTHQAHLTAKLLRLVAEWTTTANAPAFACVGKMLVAVGSQPPQPQRSLDARINLACRRAVIIEPILLLPVNPLGRIGKHHPAVR